MDQLELVVTIVALLTVTVLSTLAVFHPAYSDTTVQRIALAGIAMGALGVAWWCWQTKQAPGPLAWLSVAVALFAAETARKLARRIRRGCWTEQA
jgi:hypothetical protein